MEAPISSNASTISETSRVSSPLNKVSKRASLAKFTPVDQETISLLNPDYPNATARKYLAFEWKKLSTEEQIILRAKRTKRGIKCDICGLAGYFRENCPNECQSPPPTPSSTDSTPRPKKNKKKSKHQDKDEKEGPKLAYLDFTANSDTTSMKEGDENSSIQSLGVFWGSQAKSLASSSSFGDTEKKKKRRPRPTENYYKEGPSVSLLKQKVDLSTARPDATFRKEELRESDSTLGHFSFYNKAEKNYARNHSELTLQQVMRRLIRLLQTQLQSNIKELESTFDTSLLAPPSNKNQKNFYPEHLFHEDQQLRDYYVKKQSQKKNDNLSYRHQGSLRPIDDLDVVFRGEKTSYDDLYSTRKNAGESIHAKNTWKSVLAKNDILANSDPSLIFKQKKIDKLFENQSKWISLQSTDMKYRNDRFEHLLYMLHAEIEKEHEREGRILLAETRSLEKNVALDLWQERLSSVDLMIKVLHAYHFTAGLEEADFLLFCLEEWKHEGKRRVARFYGGDTSSHHDNATVSTADLTARTSNEEEGEEGKDGDDDTHNHSHVTSSTKKSKKSNSTASNNNNGRRDLVASSTHPYFQDVEYLKKTKRQHDKLREKSKTGTVFTGAANREIVERQKQEQEQKLLELENSVPMRSVETLLKSKTHPLITAVNPNDRMSPNRRMSIMTPAATTGSALESMFAQSKEIATLPSLEEITQQAMKHKEELDEFEEKKQRQRDLMSSSKAHENFTVKRFRHPRELDIEHVAQMKASFRRAGLGNRIRKGNDDDLAMVLPALIPIPKAFDGNSQTISHTGQNIIFKLKKNMVLSNLGYTPQTVVPLYVRNTLLEKEGTSISGDPTQDELAMDRRYAHYVGRPLVRFNPPEAVKEIQDSLLGSSANSEILSTTNGSLQGSSTSLKRGGDKSLKGTISNELIESKFLKNDLSALNESFEEPRRLLQSTVPIYTTKRKSETSKKGTLEVTNIGTVQDERTMRREMKALQKEAKEKNFPMTNSLVRLAFKKDPNLEDLNCLHDEF
eukprot:gene4710-5046_t